MTDHLTPSDHARALVLFLHKQSGNDEFRAQGLRTIAHLDPRGAEVFNGAADRLEATAQMVQTLLGRHRFGTFREDISPAGSLFCVHCGNSMWPCPDILSVACMWWNDEDFQPEWKALARGDVTA